MRSATAARVMENSWGDTRVVLRFPLANTINIWSTALPIAVLALRVRRVGRPAAILLAFYLISVTCDILGTWMGRHNVHNLWLIDLDGVMEFSALVLFLHAVAPVRRAQMLYRGAWVFFIVFWLTAKCTFEPFFGRYGYTHSLSNALLCVLAVHSLVLRAGRDDESAIVDHRFVGGAFILLYNATSLFVLGFMDSILALGAQGVREFWPYLWLINAVVNALFAAAYFWVTRGHGGFRSGEIAA